MQKNIYSVLYTIENMKYIFDKINNLQFWKAFRLSFVPLYLQKKTFLKVFLLASCSATVSNYDRFFIFVNGVSHLFKCKSDLKQKPKIEDAGLSFSISFTRVNPFWSQVRWWRSGYRACCSEALGSEFKPSSVYKCGFPKLLNLRMGRC